MTVSAVIFFLLSTLAFAHLADTFVQVPQYRVAQFHVSPYTNATRLQAHEVRVRKLIFEKRQLKPISDDIDLF